MTRRSRISAGGAAAAAFLVLGQTAIAQESAPVPAGDDSVPPAAAATTQAAHVPVFQRPRPPRSRLKLEVVGPHGGSLTVGKRARAVATLRPYVRGERVSLLLERNGHVTRTIKRKVHKVAGRNSGRVSVHTPRLIKPGRYNVVAVHEKTRRLDRSKDAGNAFHLSYPDPHGTSRRSGIFNDLLRHEGYGNAPGGNTVNDATRRAVLAFRKVNGMPRTYDPTPGIFRRLAAGKGAFHPKYPGAGRHVEVDISRQVMALIAHRKAQFTYHVSTGAPATPTVRGHFHFYRREPGMNNHGMYYSVYFYGGYATHGYASVPTYNASHGCVRNPIPDSRFIYDWIRLGESIYVYG